MWRWPESGWFILEGDCLRHWGAFVFRDTAIKFAEREFPGEELGFMRHDGTQWVRETWLHKLRV